MRELQQILENHTVRRLAWALVAFLWQGTLVAAILACLGVVLRRRDPRYHPAVWWVSRRIRVERENCCDDLAVAATGDAHGYVRALLVLEEIRSLPKTTPGLAVAADGGSLWRRIVRLLPSSSPRAEETPRWLAGLLALDRGRSPGRHRGRSLRRHLRGRRRRRPGWRAGV